MALLVRSALTLVSVASLAQANVFGNIIGDLTNNQVKAASSSCTPVTVTTTHTTSAKAVTVTTSASASTVYRTVTSLVSQNNAAATSYVTVSVTVTAPASSAESSSSSTSFVSSSSLVAYNASSTLQNAVQSTSSSSISSSVAYNATSTFHSAVLSTSSSSISGSIVSSANSTVQYAALSTSSSTISSSAVSTLATASATSGTVVLPYATYAATLNVSYSLYTYKNVRFADPPTGDLRLKNPVAPTTVNTTIQDGSYGQTCYQLEQGPDSGAANQGEDCLFMDIVVPENIPTGTLLPVMFYLFGGGYHSGQKEIYDGSPLVTASNNSMIYVVPNYRLGAFGFFGEFGDVMPGLMDQVLAMEWVQSYIHLFGGDASEVTVAGHSAGGGSLMTHLVSNGGEGTLPFKRAVVMSPAVPPNSEAEYITERNAEILEYFGFSNYTREDIIALPASSINDLTAHHGATSWGPIVDGDYFRELPGYAMAAGRYHSDLPIISGKLSDEAHNYIPTTSPYIIDGDSDIRNMSYDTKDLMTSFFSTVEYHLNSTLIDETWEVYPTINNTDMYYTIFGKYDHIYTESLFSCNSYYLETAYASVHSWYFDIWPGYHAQENPYLFVGGSGSGSTSSYAINATVSTYMKSYLVNFIMSGDVNAGGIAPQWDPYSTAQQNIELGSSNVGMIADPMTNDRCVFWQSHLH